VFLRSKNKRWVLFSQFTTDPPVPRTSRILQFPTDPPGAASSAHGHKVNKFSAQMFTYAAEKGRQRVVFSMWASTGERIILYLRGIAQWPGRKKHHSKARVCKRAWTLNILNFGGLLAQSSSEHKARPSGLLIWIGRWLSPLWNNLKHLSLNPAKRGLMLAGTVRTFLTFLNTPWDFC
jgi:hypothetical protein